MTNKMVLDEKTQKWIDLKELKGYIKGIVHVSEKYIELGWFKESPDNIQVMLGSDCLDRCIVTGISREALPELMWSNNIGYYVVPFKMDQSVINRHRLLKGWGSFPYSFAKNYEAAESFKLFNGKQKVLDPANHVLSKYMNYTFGLEFETSMGYIPQEKCFRDGLIPLRDGSITGIEYSTVVLQGNRGLSLLHQQLDTLKEYTEFNKECALHIHMGGYPVTPAHILSLYSVWYIIEDILIEHGYIPPLSFNTKEYKANGKDYCKKLPVCFNEFTELYKFMTERKFMGSLVQPHHRDIKKQAKWNIPSRYYGLNLINMLCYKGPKTVEFRFLRPTFNFRKIMLWLYILNAVLKYSETLAEEWIEQNDCSTKGMQHWIEDEKFNDMYSMLSAVYPVDIVNYLVNEIRLLKMSVQMQVANGDLCGRDTKFEDDLFV